jgi:predicted Zn-ribbon and HTH transcriptional regulator
MPADREARLTLPQAVREALRGPTPKALDQLSRELGVSEKLLPDALEKLSKSLVHQGQRLRQEPARCVVCDFVFDSRERTKRPSRCARCGSERLTRPRFWIE